MMDVPTLDTVLPSTTFSLGNTATWVQALRDDHPCPERTVAGTIMQQFVRYGVAWRPAIEIGLYDTLMDILGDSYICGFSEEELRRQDMEYHETVTLPYLIDMLAIFSESMGYLSTLAHCNGHTRQVQVDPKDAHCQDCVLIERVAFRIAEPLQTFLDRLWSIRNPLLTKAVDFVTPHDIQGNRRPWSLGRALVWCYLSMDGIVTKLKDIPVWNVWRKPFFSFTLPLSQVYRYSQVKNPVSRNALGWLMGALDHVTRREHGLWAAPQWFNATVTEQHHANDEREALFDRVLRDFKHSDDWDDEPNCDYLFVHLVSFIRKIRALPLIEMQGPRDRALLWFSMAAYRRQLCSSSLCATDEDKADYNTYDAMNECFYINQVMINYYKHSWTKPPFPEVWIHAMIPVYALGMGPAGDDVYPEGALEKPENWAQAIGLIIRVLQWYNKNPSKDSRRPDRGPPSESMKRFTYRAWEQGRADLMKHNFDTKLKCIWIEWLRLGKELALGIEQAHQDEKGENVNGLFKRCHWDRCACSVFKANHRLKACDGCSAVAYCNQRCQEQDWADHRAVCVGANQFGAKGSIVVPEV